LGFPVEWKNLLDHIPFSYGGIIRIRYKGRSEILLAHFLSANIRAPQIINLYHDINDGRVSMEKQVLKNEGAYDYSKTPRYARGAVVAYN